MSMAIAYGLLRIFFLMFVAFSFIVYCLLLALLLLFLTVEVENLYFTKPLFCTSVRQ